MATHDDVFSKAYFDDTIFTTSATSTLTSKTLFGESMFDGYADDVSGVREELCDRINFIFEAMEFTLKPQLIMENENTHEAMRFEKLSEAVDTLTVPAFASMKESDAFGYAPATRTVMADYFRGHEMVIEATRRFTAKDWLE